MSSASLFKGVNDYVARHYGENPGKMLIHTGVIGWVLSSAAQVAAIVINDKIPKEQKMFIVPQEMSDAAVNIASFYLITQSFKSVAAKLVKTGKWAPKVLRDFLNDNKLADKVGKADFNVFKDIQLSKDTQSQLNSFRDGVDLVATTVGSILSCNIVTPLLRNEIAAHGQKRGIQRMNDKIPQPVPSQKPAFEKNMARMNDFQTMAYNKYSSGSLKV